MTLKARWLDWSGRFAALQKREKHLVIGAVLFAILFGGYTFWIEPAQLQKARLKKDIEQQRLEQAQLTTQLAALAASGDPDAANRAALNQLRKRLADAERDIHGFSRMLVAPAQAPALLQALLARHRGLALVSLTTLEPRPLLAPPPDKDGKDGKTAPAVMPGGNLYKHGIEIRVSGAYLDLLSWVAELEGGERKLLWEGMSLASKYPVSELTLTVYTLSLESAWLVV